jgi:hypothetical protein
MKQTRSVRQHGGVPLDLVEPISFRQIHVWKVLTVANKRFLLNGTEVPGVTTDRRGTLANFDVENRSGFCSEYSNDTIVNFLKGQGFDLRTGDILRFVDPERSDRNEGLITVVNAKLGLSQVLENDGGHKYMPVTFD